MGENSVWLFGIMLVVLFGSGEMTCKEKRAWLPEDQITDDPNLRFLMGEPGNLEITCVGYYVALHCCMLNFDHIEWREMLKRTGDIYDWVPLYSGPNVGRELSEENQTVVIQRAELKRDQKKYQCIGYDTKGHNISNEITLRIDSCAPERPSTFLIPDTQNSTHEAIPGHDINIQCSAFFHSKDWSKGSHIWWYKTMPYPNGSIDYVFMDKNSSNRIWMTPMTSENNATNIWKSSLIIREVELKDYDSTYVCDTSTANDGDRRYISLLKKDPPQPVIMEKTPGYMKGLIGLAVTVVVLMTLLIVVWFQYNVEIKVFWKTRIKKPPIIGDKEHHIFLLFNTENLEERDFGRQDLYPFLTDDLKYDVYSSHQIDYGQSNLESYARATDNSALLMVVISPNLFEEGEVAVCIRDAIKQSKRIIYVVRGSLPEQSSDMREFLMGVRSGETVYWPVEGSNPSHPKKFICLRRRQYSVPYCKLQIQLKLLNMLNPEANKKTCACLKSHGHRDDNNSDNIPIATVYHAISNTSSNELTNNEPSATNGNFI